MAFRSTPAYDTHDFKKENSLVSWSFELFCLSCRDFRRFLGMGFLLLKLAGIFFGILAGCIILMEAAGRWISHLMGA